MPDFFPTLRRLVLPMVFAGLCLCNRGDLDPAAAPAAMPFAAAMPQTVVWAWEEPEDLRGAPASVGVAYLAETLFVGKPTIAAGGPTVGVVSRHQPLAVAPGTAVMAVVRVIALPGFQDSESARDQTAAALAEAAQEPGLRAFQIDFDATRSQRAFYSAVLARLRRSMPAGMPLSITALLSWCAANPGSGDWLSSLSIDEAVPMFFRLGGSARPDGDKTSYTLGEPLCRGSLGISTDESWPRINPYARVYVFAPRPWTPLQLAALEGIRSGGRPTALQFDFAAVRIHPPNDTGLPAAAGSAPRAEIHSEEHLP